MNDGPLLCSYADSEGVAWYGDSYDFQPTFLGASWRNCPFCKSKMRSMTDEHEKYVLASCDVCGFWRVVDTSQLGGFHHSRKLSAHRGIAKLFQVADLDAPIADLKRYLRHNPTHIAHVNPYAFEDLIGSCLRAAFSGCEVIKVGGRRDRGIDLILVQTTGERYLVQVKRRSNINKNESVDVVRQLNGVIFRENAAKGLVITTARDYTADAEQETRAQSDRGIWQSIDLYGFEDIVNWLNILEAKPYEPWRPLIGAVQLTKSIL
jgi:HJR/Mrr/RecB family endonuclease